MSNSASQSDARPRTRSMLSFRSNRSHKSNKTAVKLDLKETHAEKERVRVKTKADPTLAISEDEPSSVAAATGNITSLSSLEHKDRSGNVITEPDRSNPTRNRWERPLDTVRAFEAAIDGKYNRRAQAVAAASRRSSYQQAPQQQHPVRPGRDNNAGVNGFYTNRIYQSPIERPDSYADASSPSPNGYYRPRYVPRMASEPMPNTTRNGRPGVYPVHAYQHSYDTVTTGSNVTTNTTSDQWASSTDPSSDNSSLDRVQAQAPPPRKPDLGEVYGFTGFGDVPQLKGPALDDPPPSNRAWPPMDASLRSDGFGTAGTNRMATMSTGNPFTQPRSLLQTATTNTASKYGNPTDEVRAVSARPGSADKEKRKSLLRIFGVKA